MKYCSRCGNQLTEAVKFCPHCGNGVEPDSHVNYNDNQSVNQNVNALGKSKLAAGILGIFLGCLGIHNFYLGYTSKAVCQLLLTLVGWILCGLGPIAAAIWGLVEGILILTGSITTDVKGNHLSD